MKMDSITIEPGDATRYDLDIIRVGEHDLLVVLYKDRRRTGGVAMNFYVGPVYHQTYNPQQVATLMGCDLSQAAVILAYLRLEYNVNAGLGPGFNQDTGVWVGNTIH